MRGSLLLRSFFSIVNIRTLCDSQKGQRETYYFVAIFRLTKAFESCYSSVPVSAFWVVFVPPGHQDKLNPNFIVTLN